jgi:hypothetical protein
MAVLLMISNVAFVPDDDRMKIICRSSTQKCYCIANAVDHVDAIQDMWSQDTAEGEVVKR